MIPQTGSENTQTYHVKVAALSNTKFLYLIYKEICSS